jgi:hypothetical protein
MPPLPKPISHTANAIDAAIVANARNGDGAGVAMSSAVHECDRNIWLTLRWASPPETPSGQRERRFRAGHQYEKWLLDDLRAIGCEVIEIDETTGQQIRIELANGHLRGKLDGIATGLPEAPSAAHVVECKSHNDKSFKEVVKKGLREGKPDHFAQCQLYMHGTGINRALYIAESKNTAEQYCERIEYDPAFCLALEARIERIVFAPRPPAKNEGFWCGFCNHKSTCLEGAFARINCRTCLHSEPGDGASWRCARFDKALSYTDMQAGCPAHLFVPDLVPGEQIDADEDAATVTYKLADGSTWIDGEGVR